MRDLIKALAFAFIFFSPCVIASYCASERKWRRRSSQPAPEIERRDHR